MSTIDEVLQRLNDLCVIEQYRIDAAPTSNGVVIDLCGAERQRYCLPEGVGTFYFNGIQLESKGVREMGKRLNGFIETTELETALSCDASAALGLVWSLQSGARVFTYEALAYQQIETLFQLPSLRTCPHLTNTS
ncbi:hypothetical protein HY489_00895 [Candidatus Woesearchaeota archaeon]|nr:hypothetical protein [Candidatus Woesearchaeota archaeon]